jgi:hypothetical protein
VKLVEFLILDEVMIEQKRSPNDLIIPPPKFFREGKSKNQREQLLDAVYE